MSCRRSCVHLSEWRKGKRAQEATVIGRSLLMRSTSIPQYWAIVALIPPARMVQMTMTTTMTISLRQWPNPCAPVLRSSWMLCSTWAGGLRPSRFACWCLSLVLRYSVRALGEWQYGWYVVTRAWEISQAYKVFQGSLQVRCNKLDWHKNSDLGSEVGTGTGLNSTALRLLESVVLLTKSIGIWTPLVLGIVVAVAPRLILYTENTQDRIVHSWHRERTRSYHT